jgi:pyruvate formate lyase activating enzyme
MKEARYYEIAGSGYVRCLLCPHRCQLAEGRTGLCRTRTARGGKLWADGFGIVSSAALDPIEKKPLKMYKPGSIILSVGGWGCNMRCRFCQNADISQYGPAARLEEADAASGESRESDESGKSDPNADYVTPEMLAAASEAQAGRCGNIGVAFTYNEPFVNIEYLLETAPRIKAQGQDVVLVTNGLVEQKPLMDLLPYVDAMNIDLKAFSEVFYARHGGEIAAVKATIAAAAARCHVEVTTLVIPGENDDLEEMEALMEWLGSIDRDIPLHLTRFFPRYKMEGNDILPTPVETLRRLENRAKIHLRHVFLGNV